MIYYLYIFKVFSHCSVRYPICCVIHYNWFLRRCSLHGEKLFFYKRCILLFPGYSAYAQMSNHKLCGDSKLILLCNLFAYIPLHDLEIKYLPTQHF